MELCAVVYHSGVSVYSGHYTCACRGPDGMFWLFDDATRRDTGCRRLPIDIEQVLQKSVYVLVYVRPRGAVEFADMGGVPAGGASVGSTMPGLDGRMAVGSASASGGDCFAVHSSAWRCMRCCCCGACCQCGLCAFNADPFAPGEEGLYRVQF